MSKMHVKFNVSPEEFLANLTQAAYQVVLNAGPSSPFIEIELEMQRALRESIGKDMLVTTKIKNSRGKLLLKKLKPWSLRAKSIFLRLENKYAMLGFGRAVQSLEK